MKFLNTTKQYNDICFGNHDIRKASKLFRRQHSMLYVVIFLFHDIQQINVIDKVSILVVY